MWMGLWGCCASLRNRVNSEISRFSLSFLPLLPSMGCPKSQAAKGFINLCANGSGTSHARCMAVISSIAKCWANTLANITDSLPLGSPSPWTFGRYAFPVSSVPSPYPQVVQATMHPKCCTPLRKASPTPVLSVKVRVSHLWPCLMPPTR